MAQDKYNPDEAAAVVEALVANGTLEFVPIPGGMGARIKEPFTTQSGAIEFIPQILLRSPDGQFTGVAQDHMVESTLFPSITKAINEYAEQHPELAQQ